MVTYAGFMIFYTVPPFILQHHLSVSHIHFGWITLAITSFILLSKLYNALFIHFFGVEQLIRYSLILMFLGALSLFCFLLTSYYSLIVVVVPFLMSVFSSGFLFSNKTNEFFNIVVCVYCSRNCGALEYRNTTATKFAALYNECDSAGCLYFYA